MKMYAGTDLKDLRRYFRYSCEKIDEGQLVKYRMSVVRRSMNL